MILTHIFYSFYITSFVDTISIHGLRSEVVHGNQPNDSTYKVLHNLLFLLKESFKTIICKYQDGELQLHDMYIRRYGIHILRHLKEEVSWALINDFGFIGDLKHNYTLHY